MINDKKDKLSILVLLYNCEVLNSVTIKSLFDYRRSIENFNLVIWNNGPRKLKPFSLDGLIENSASMTVIETLDNISLAEVYNTFVVSFSADHYVILDHDSQLSARYLEALQRTKNYDIGLPLLQGKGNIIAPRVNGSIYKKNQSLKARDKIVSIGSGLVFSQNVVEKMIHEFGSIFDERFYLYGVDTTFFLRVRKLKRDKLVFSILPGFEHSFSRLECESHETKNFRRVERSYDFGLRLRYYFGIDMLCAFCKLCLGKPLRKFDYLSLRLIIKTLFKGYHPRFKRDK